MCQGTFGCPIIAAGFATTAIPNSRFSIVGTIVDFVAEFSVAGVPQIVFLHSLVSRELPVKTGIRLEYAITASSNGRNKA